jgi:hypothetical protein
LKSRINQHFPTSILNKAARITGVRKKWKSERRKEDKSGKHNNLPAK